MSCDWPVDRSCLPELPVESDPGYDAAVDQQNAAVDLAVSVLWALSGRRFGVCQEKVRPCPSGRQDHRLDRPVAYSVVWTGEHWLNETCGCGPTCEISGPHTVHLPGPAQSITEVEINGAVIPPSGYALEGDTLYRVGAVWPTQNLDAPLGGFGTWAVTYMRGQAVPSGVARLTGLLAQEFYNACTGSGKCRLPRNVTAVTRQGVSYQVYDPNSIYNSGKTGLPEVDSWLAAVNPHALSAAPSVI